MNSNTPRPERTLKHTSKSTKEKTQHAPHTHTHTHTHTSHHQSPGGCNDSNAVGRTHVLQARLVLTLSVFDSLREGDCVVGRDQRVRRHRVWPSGQLLRQVKLDARWRRAIRRPKGPGHAGVRVAQQLRPRTRLPRSKRGRCV